MKGDYPLIRAMTEGACPGPCSHAICARKRQADALLAELDALRAVPPVPGVEALARRFHEVYEDLAPSFGWDTQQRSRTSWDDLPPQNRALMLAVVERIFGPLCSICGTPFTPPMLAYPESAGTVCGDCLPAPTHSGAASELRGLSQDPSGATMTDGYWKIVIDTCGRPLVNNAGDKMHWAARQAARDQWRDSAAVLARAARIPHMQAIAVTCWAEYPNRSSLPDCDGIAPSLKGALDGLVVAGVIPDDRPPHVAGITYLPAVVRAGARPALVLEISAAGGVVNANVRDAEARAIAVLVDAHRSDRDDWTPAMWDVAEAAAEVLAGWVRRDGRESS